MPAPAAATLIDEVDASNIPIGTVRRDTVFERGVNFRTVHVLLTNSDGDLLVQQLALGRERHPGQWGSSVAGYLFAGESYAGAADRRVREELGVTPSLTDEGVMPLEDAGVTKFVGVFTGQTQHAVNAVPDHIAEIEFRPVDRIAGDIELGLSTYTDTFVQVFAYWRSL